MEKDYQKYITDHIWEHSSLICLYISKKGTIVRANAFAEKLTGKKLENLSINKLFIHFKNPKEITEYLYPVDKTHLINIENSYNLPSSYYFRFYDIGEHVLAIGEANNLEIEFVRKSMVDMNNELNNLTRELHKKNAELKKTDELKNKFLGIAAHDLRNPIGNIMGLSELLTERLKDEIAQKHITMLGAIKSSSEFLLKLLDELLDITAIESGKLTLNPEKTDIVELIKHNIDLNNISASKKNIWIDLEFEKNLPSILIDKLKIEQVLNNLISNAIKFSYPDSNIKVKVSPAGNKVIVMVKDEGQGIPENEIDKIFKPYGKTSVIGTDNEKSTGLGLAIAWNIINGHGGEIWVESEPGKGSEFSFSLLAGNQLEEKGEISKQE